MNSTAIRPIRFHHVARARLTEGIWALRSTLKASLRSNASIEWLFILTLPNTGSTALAQLLRSASRVATLTPNGEGQWLVPAMSLPIKRWDPDHRINYAAVRAIWLNRIAQYDTRDLVVIEKSPPNLCRHAALIGAFSSMKTTVFTFSRDPYATCASWHRRYGRDGVARFWGFDTPPRTELEYFEALGRLCAERMRMLYEAKERYGNHIRYEDFCSDPRAAIARIAAMIPAIADADPSTAVAVKDYEPQPIRNMNEDQIARLSAAQLGAVSAGLRESKQVLESFGYHLRD